MKFYEFNKFEYYALIMAETEEKAFEGYEEVVAEIEEREKELKPDIITKEQALQRYRDAEIKGCVTAEEKTNDFNKSHKYFADEIKEGYYDYWIVLIDGFLRL